MTVGADRSLRRAMHLSLGVGVLMLVGKLFAYFVTGSTAILSDAAESVVHVFAVSFAAFSLQFSRHPADETHPYGHDKISFFSAGIEGVLIIIAAIVIIFEAIRGWVGGLAIRNIDTGVYLVAAASILNAGLGLYLVWVGKRHNSLILISNGKHVLTDSWTSFGVVAGLALVLFTGWLPFDPLIAIAVAGNILWTGGRLVRTSVGGLMDEVDPELDGRIRAILAGEATAAGLDFHRLRHRQTGAGIWIDFHLLFPRGTDLEQAHDTATRIEAVLKRSLPLPATVVTHLEPLEGHEDSHRKHDISPAES